MCHSVPTKVKREQHLRSAGLEIAVGVAAADWSLAEGKGYYAVPNVPAGTLKCPEALGRRGETVIGWGFFLSLSLESELLLAECDVLCLIDRK